MNPSPKSLLDRLVAITVTLLFVALGLSCVWHLVRPLVPVLVLGAVVFVIVKIVRQRNSW